MAGTSCREYPLLLAVWCTCTCLIVRLYVGRPSRQDSFAPQWRRPRIFGRGTKPERRRARAAPRRAGLLVAGQDPRPQQHQRQARRQHSPDTHLHAVRRSDPHQVGPDPGVTLPRLRVRAVREGRHRPPARPTFVAAGAHLQAGAVASSQVRASIVYDADVRASVSQTPSGPAVHQGASSGSSSSSISSGSSAPVSARPSGVAPPERPRPPAHAHTDGADSRDAAQGRLEHRSAANLRLAHLPFIAQSARRARGDTPGFAHQLHPRRQCMKYDMLMDPVALAHLVTREIRSGDRDGRVDQDRGRAT